MTNEPTVGIEGDARDSSKRASRGRRVARLQRLSKDDLQLRQTWQVAAGAILFPLGIVVIMLGWYGAAHASHVQQQIPYLVSGSFVGLGLMIVGALLYWAHWLYRIYDQADAHHRELLEALRGAEPGQAVAIAGTSANGTVFATENGSTYHRESCAVIARRRDGARVVTAAERRRLQPCQICQPDAVDGRRLPGR